MHISDVTMEKLLIRSGVATAEQVSVLKQEAASSKRPIQDLTIQNDIADEKTLAKAFSEYAQVPYIELKAHDIPSDVLNKIPERIARQYNAILFKIDEISESKLANAIPPDCSFAVFTMISLK